MLLLISFCYIYLLFYFCSGYCLLESEKALVIKLDSSESNMISVKSTPLDKNKEYTFDLEQFLRKFYELQKWKCQHYFYIVNQSKLIEVF